MAQNNVRVGIGVFVFKNGTFLMQQRHGAHGAGSWSVPGGHLEFGDSEFIDKIKDGLSAPTYR